MSTASDTAGAFERRTGVRPWVAVLALVAVLVAAMAGGVAAIVIAATRPTPPPADVLTPDQAKTQACNAFTVASRRWTEAYREWLPIVETPGWRWGDRAVQDATSRFSAQEAEIITQLNSLIPSDTPTDVAQAIRGYANAILEYSAGHGVSDQQHMDQQEFQIDDAADDVGRVC